MKKEFDCVEMKMKIQEELLREEEELGSEEAERRRARRIAEDPILGSFVARVTERRASPAA